MVPCVFIKENMIWITIILSLENYFLRVFGSFMPKGRKPGYEKYQFLVSKSCHCQSKQTKIYPPSHNTSFLLPAGLWQTSKTGCGAPPPGYLASLPSWRDAFLCLHESSSHDWFYMKDFPQISFSASFPLHAHQKKSAFAIHSGRGRPKHPFQKLLHSASSAKILVLFILL